jgi:hypothetical protein
MTNYARCSIPLACVVDGATFLAVSATVAETTAGKITLGHMEPKRASYTELSTKSRCGADAGGCRECAGAQSMPLGLLLPNLCPEIFAT